MPQYKAYGLILESALPLPELPTEQGRTDVTIKVEAPGGIAPRERSPIQCASASLSRTHLTWGRVGDLRIEEGCRIIVQPDENAAPAALRLFVLGAGLGVLLHQRGFLVLHASGVAIDDFAIGLVGVKGAGKSTTAAALQQIGGHKLIADELLVVRANQQEQPLVVPGPPHIRLWLDALTHLEKDPDLAARVRPGLDKFCVPVSDVAGRAIPLSRLYLLDAGDENSVGQFSSIEAFLGLVPHLYVSRFGTPFLIGTQFAETFRKLDFLLSRIAVKRLSRRRNLSLLPEIVQLVETDMLKNS